MPYIATSNLSYPIRLAIEKADAAYWRLEKKRQLTAAGGKST